MTRVSRIRTLVAILIASLFGVRACSSSSGANTTIHLVAYSVPKPAHDALPAAFEKTPAGKGVQVPGSYGPSGSQSKAVLAGQQADYVGFSVAAAQPTVVRLARGQSEALGLAAGSRVWLRAAPNSTSLIA